MKFEHEPGCVPLDSAENFKDLLGGLRDHLCTSKTTRAFYVDMAQEFYAALPAKRQHQHKLPTDRNFEDYLKFQWPTIKTIVRNKHQLRWGYVRKGDGTPHTIHILSDIVASAERAVSTPIPGIPM